jgi:hypothetical protein
VEFLFEAMEPLCVIEINGDIVNVARGELAFSLPHGELLLFELNHLSYIDIAVTMRCRKEMGIGAESAADIDECCPRVLAEE